MRLIKKVQLLLVCYPTKSGRVKSLRKMFTVQIKLINPLGPDNTTLKNRSEGRRRAEGSVSIAYQYGDAGGAVECLTDVLWEHR